MKCFERPGPENTNAVIDVVEKAASRCEYIVVASITGESALSLAGRIKGKKIICVTCPQGMYWEADKMDQGPFADIPELSMIRDTWLKEGKKRIPMCVTEDNRARLRELAIPVVQGTIPLFGPSFSMRVHLRQMTSLDVIAKTLELFSTGTLVCLESVMMAVDANAIPEGKQVIALAGTERGLDSAWVIRSSASANMFDPVKGSRFMELLAKPGISTLPDISIDYIR
jgi:hypothetical protein